MLIRVCRCVRDTVVVKEEEERRFSQVAYDFSYDLVWFLMTVITWNS